MFANYTPSGSSFDDDFVWLLIPTVHAVHRIAFSHPALAPFHNDCGANVERGLFKDVDHRSLANFHYKAAIVPPSGE